MTHLLFLLHVGSTLYMMGLIWFVQVVHYPLHAHVGAEQFSNYQHLHMNWTTFVVGPPMLIEMATTVWFLLEPPLHIPNSYFWIGAAMLGIQHWFPLCKLDGPPFMRLSCDFLC